MITRNSGIIGEGVDRAAGFGAGDGLDYVEAVKG